jgi:hypothetical protein
MNIHWNWGTKLFIAIVIFMSFIFVLVYLSAKNQIDLVEKDYYPKGLKYQDRIDEMSNAKSFGDSFFIERVANQVVVSHTILKADTGSIYFFRPSDNSLDMTYQFKPDTSGKVFFDVSKFKKGKYLVKVFWKESGKGFYIEKTFNYN